jgi:hypothetical protein
MLDGDDDQNVRGVGAALVKTAIALPQRRSTASSETGTGGLGGVGRQAHHAGTLEHSLRVIDATTALALVIGISLEKQLGRHVVKALGGVYGYVMQRAEEVLDHERPLCAQKRSFHIAHSANRSERTIR